MREPEALVLEPRSASRSLFYTHTLPQVRLLEHTAVAKEHAKADNEVKLVEQAARTSRLRVMV